LFVWRGVAEPVDEVLETSSEVAWVQDGFDFEMFIHIDKVRGWAGKVGDMGSRFTIRGQKGGVENRVDAVAPGGGNSEVEGDGVNQFLDGEGAVTSWGKFQGGEGGV
jgi:hypothetical protein